MSRLSRSLCALAVSSLAAALLLPSEANACGGGGFYTVSSSETVGTTGHRVVISISKAQSVLWDQMTFQGDPADFAWVYPAKPGSYVEVATDGFVEAIDAVTTKVIQSPEVLCGSGSSGGGTSCACWPGSAADGGGTDSRGADQDTSVTVKHQGTIGPYDTVTIAGATPGAIAQWLTDNGYKVPDDVAPILDDYAANGFDFIAMRLSPDKGVAQMKPVRVVTPGMNTTFPMRMLAAGASDFMALDVMILSEGRVQASGFETAEISGEELTWDFDADTSNYADVRSAKLHLNGGSVLLTSFALGNAVFGLADDASQSAAALYSQAVSASGEGSICDAALLSTLADPTSASAGYEVADLCDDQGGCIAPGANQIDSRDLNCGAATDLSTALIGMHPKDVWITRLEASFPKAALSQDLVIVPAESPDSVSRVVTAGKQTGEPCWGAGTLPQGTPAKKPPISPSGVAMLGAGLALAASYLRRRLGLRERAIA